MLFALLTFLPLMAMDVQTEVESESLKDFELMYESMHKDSIYDKYIFTDHHTMRIESRRNKSIYACYVKLGFDETDDDAHLYGNPHNYEVAICFEKIFKMLFQEKDTLVFSGDDYQVIVDTQDLKKRLFIGREPLCVSHLTVQSKKGCAIKYRPDNDGQKWAVKLLLEICAKFREHRVMCKKKLNV